MRLLTGTSWLVLHMISSSMVMLKMLCRNNNIYDSILDEHFFAQWRTSSF